MFGLRDTDIQALLRQDETSFGLFYTASIDTIYAYIAGRSFVTDPKDIDDLVSDIYVKVRQSLSKCEDASQVKGYVWTIVRNHVKDFYKKKKLLYTDDDMTTLAETVEDQSEDVLEAIDTVMRHEGIQQAMKSLDEASYQVLFFKYEQGMGYDEISLITGQDQSTLRKRHSRAIKKVKSLLDRDSHG